MYKIELSQWHEPQWPSELDLSCRRKAEHCSIFNIKSSIIAVYDELVQS